MRYEIRAATTADQREIYELSEHLDSVNLPHDEAEIAALLDTSERSFGGQIEDPRKREYVFVLRDVEKDCAVGTSTIIAQLGRRDAAYVFFDVRNEERYCNTLDRHFVHQVLSIGYSYHGPTEIGGLVVHPEYRKAKERLGMLISYVRFLYIAAHRGWFQNRVLAELMPPLEPDHTSLLWEAVGRHFTELSYQEADRLSSKSKEFIRALFPMGDIYVSLLPIGAQTVIGEVGPQTKGVARMLERIGFRYANRVDPFDGGPHFIAHTDEIELVSRTRIGPVRSGAPSGDHVRRCLVAATFDRHPHFLAVRGQVSLTPGEEIVVEESAMTHLGLDDRAEAMVLPLF